MNEFLESFEITSDDEDFCCKAAEKFTKEEIIFLCKKTKCIVQIYKYNIYRSYEEHKRKQCEKRGLNITNYKEKILEKTYKRFLANFSYHYNEKYLPMEEKRKLSAVKYFKMRCVQSYLMLCSDDCNIIESGTESNKRKSSAEATDPLQALERHSDPDSVSDDEPEIDPLVALSISNNIRDIPNPELTDSSSLDNSSFESFIRNQGANSRTSFILESQPTYEEFDKNIRNLSYTSTQNQETKL